MQQGPTDHAAEHLEPCLELLDKLKALVPKNDETATFLLDTLSLHLGLQKDGSSVVRQSRDQRPR